MKFLFLFFMATPAFAEPSPSPCEWLEVWANSRYRVPDGRFPEGMRLAIRCREGKLMLIPTVKDDKDLALAGKYAEAAKEGIKEYIGSKKWGNFELVTRSAFNIVKNPQMLGQ